MKKHKFPLLLLTALLLVSFAFLPTLAGMLQDAEVAKTVSHRPLHSIVPYISEKGSGISLPSKLRILQECEINVIVPAMASMDTEQVRAAVEAGMQPFFEAGIFRGFEVCEFHATPYVTINWQDASRWFIFWDVNLVETSGDIRYSLSVTVDDETGKFLMLQYFDPQALEQWPLWDENCVPLSAFSRLWLEQAGLWESARQVCTESDIQQVQGLHPGVRTAVYALCEDTGHPLQICFSVSGYGEYAMRIENMPQ